MTRRIWIENGLVWERGACGSLRCYSGEAAAVMALVWRYARGMVGCVGVEPTTFCLSSRCSTTELTAHPGVSAGSVGHTPSPWLAVRDPGHFHSLSTVAAGDRAEINKRHRMQVEVGGWAGPAEQEANTRLIAAAPKLLAALRSLLEDVEEDCGDPECGDCKPWRPARAAIAKATGSAP